MGKKTWLNGELRFTDDYDCEVVIDDFNFRLDSVVGVVEIDVGSTKSEPANHILLYLKGIPTPFDIKLYSSYWNIQYYYMYPENSEDDEEQEED